MKRASRDRNRRRAPRARAANLVSYADRQSGAVYSLLGAAVTVDLSETGLRLKTVEPLPIGSTLTFDLKIASEVHRLQGRVVWGEELERDRDYEFGVSLEGVPEEARKLLRLFVSVRLNER